MKASIIVFSPSGHTLQAAMLMQNSLKAQGIEVQLLDVTREKEVFSENKLVDYLVNRVECHDVLCIGGPVYAGHLEGNVHKIIKALPVPDGHWGNIAIPFITYGGLHSSIALQEAGDLLYASRRIPILGVKMASFHSLSQNLLPDKINEGRPGPEEALVAGEMAKRLKALSAQDKWVDVRKSFHYASMKHRIVLKFLSQHYFHRKYRTVHAKPEICNGCGTCKKVCPVNLIDIVDKKAVRISNGNYCLLCAECYHHCPRHAVVHEFVEQKITKKLNKEKAKYHELPRSAVYPLV